ncbi:hypothetical protein GCM10011579_098690 [Streptomyces albiflavescens]|uniref:Uncharacterized protein n=1 Tax=Streptomyces albiflavescens TaxID=1623582 RepID=A0A918DBM8_9ACTN|nr:hypothetical protein [Streptomyces albiflavescens]GGN96818.1 hypothetical protein GCM10011579_098690 [Streptomyces albiflavescens]
MARVQGVLSRRRAGGITQGQARQEVLSLLTSYTRNQAPRNAHWVYEELGEEPVERPMLGA